MRQRFNRSGVATGYDAAGNLHIMPFLTTAADADSARESTLRRLQGPEVGLRRVTVTIADREMSQAELRQIGARDRAKANEQAAAE